MFGIFKRKRDNVSEFVEELIEAIEGATMTKHGYTCGGGLERWSVELSEEHDRTQISFLDHPIALFPPWSFLSISYPQGHVDIDNTQGRRRILEILSKKATKWEAEELSRNVKALGLFKGRK